MGLLSISLRQSQDYFNEYLKPLPWIKEDVISLTWEQDSESVILKIGSADNPQGQFIFDLGVFKNVNQSNLSDDIKREKYFSFEEFTRALRATPEHTRFSEWWQQIAASQSEGFSNGRLFQFDFSQGPWEIPWELLIGLLKFDLLRNNTSIVRCIGRSKDECKIFFTDALRILIIRADSVNLNLEQDVENILNVWVGLEETVKKAVVEPKVIRAERSSIVRELQNFQPHLIWFLGHGSFDTKAHLIFSDQDSVTADEFVELFGQAGHNPMFAVFWACETLKGNLYQHSESPDLFRALVRKGVSTMVGMQSSISDDAAIVMSSQLFRGILQGLPLEWAVARARTWMYNSWYKGGEEIATMDWASPVVWTSERPVAHITWNISELDQLQLQLLGTVSIDQGLPDAGLDVEPPDSDDANRGHNWLPYSVTVVRGNPDSAEHKLWFLRTLKGIQSVSRNAVLVIVPVKTGTFKQNMQLWARGFLSSLEKGKLPDDFFDAVDILSNDAEIGWQRLCALEHIFLAVIDPPPASEDWFWKPFFLNPVSRAVLTPNEVPVRYQEMQINYVIAGEQVSLTRIDSASEKHLLILSTLAILNIPVKIESLKRLEIGLEPDNLINQWPDLFVKCFGGYVIRADVRERILSTIDNDTLSQARQICLLFTSRMINIKNGYLREFRIRLLLEQGEIDQALYELSDLWHLYRSRNDQVALFRTVMEKRYFALRDYLSPWDWLERASILLQFGFPERANYWLMREPEDQLDVPFKLSLQAELKKMEGDIGQARALIEQAVVQCREYLASQDLSVRDRLILEQDFLSYRHDRARLLHFFENDYVSAAKEYQEIIRESEGATASDNPHLVHLLAVANRNLGECILDLGVFTEDAFRDAESHLQTAIELEREQNNSSNLISEVYYQLARVAGKRGRTEQAKQYLLVCQTTAQINHYGLMSAIAQNRLLWLDVKENNWGYEDLAPRWNLIEATLKGHATNSWAARTLLIANIKLSTLLRNEGKLQRGQQVLLENLNMFRSNRSLRRRGDLIRIVRTLAGLQLMEDDLQGQQNYWALLQTEFIEAGVHAEQIGWLSPLMAWQGDL